MNRAVFGMGIALINHWSLIKKNFRPQFGIDNNASKWEKVEQYTGLKCFSLQQVKGIENLEVLITVGDPYVIETLSAQLRDARISFVVLTDVLDEWCKDLALPDHLSMLNKNEKKIVLFNTPEHDNVGDHLITLAELSFLEKYFNEYKIYEVTDIEYLWYHNKIKKCLNTSDIILITGGGYIGSLWLYNGETNVRNIIKEYPNNRIIILPQTVYFENNDRGNKELQETQKIFRNHNELILCAREENSYNQFISIIGTDKNVHLLPDMALLYSEMDIQRNRECHDVVICLREDKEKVIDASDKKKIIDYYMGCGMKVKIISMHSGDFGGLGTREKQVAQKLREIADAKLVITDTLHCMISSALVGTECIAFDNLSGKVGNVYKWINQLEYIHFYETVEDFKMVLQDRTALTQPRHFELKHTDTYESELELIIKGEKYGRTSS